MATHIECEDITNWFSILSLNRQKKYSDGTFFDSDWTSSSDTNITYDPGTDSWYESRNLVTFDLPVGCISVTIPDMGWNSVTGPLFQDVDHSVELAWGPIADAMNPDFDGFGSAVIYSETANAVDSFIGRNTGDITVAAAQGAWMLFFRNISPETYGNKKPPPSGTLQVIPAFDPTMDPTPTGDSASSDATWSPLPVLTIRVCRSVLGPCACRPWDGTGEPQHNQPVNDELVGTGDGVTTVFATAFPYDAQSLEVEVDGEGEDFDPTDYLTGTFTMLTAPGMGLPVVASYLRARFA